MVAAFSCNATAQNISFVQFVFVNSNNGVDWGYNKHKKPADFSKILPTVSYDSAADELTFEGTSALENLTYEISDANEEVLLSDTFPLNGGENKKVSVASLSSGCYTITLYIGEYEFCGEFIK